MVSCWCCRWYAAGRGDAASFFLAMENGEFNNGGGGAAATAVAAAKGGGVQWRRHCLMEATQQLAGMQ